MGRPITKAHRDDRRKQAEQRQAVYDKLSRLEKLTRVEPGSKQERKLLRGDGND